MVGDRSRSCGCGGVGLYWCFSEGRIVMIRFGWVRVPGPLLPCADGRKYAEMISPQSCGAEMHQGGFGTVSQWPATPGKSLGHACVRHTLLAHALMQEFSSVFVGGIVIEASLGPA